MAKQKIPSEETASPSSEKPTVNENEKDIGTANEGKETEPESFIADILRRFPSYPALYIDKYGGAFTLDTPVGIRRDAVQYTNPFYTIET